MNKMQEIYKLFSFSPQNEDVFVLAFTHPSVNGIAKTSHQDYERLEFLGDSVIGMVVSELCYIYHPDMDQGELSVLKTQFVRSESEAKYAKKYGFEKYISVGNSFKKDIDKATNVLEDVFESFVGALLIDQGLDFTYKTVRDIFEDDVKNAKIIVEENPKSELQEAMQADYKESVNYRILLEEGPSHDRHYVAGVYFEEKELGRGEGKSKKEAEVAAAKDALSKLALPEREK